MSLNLKKIIFSRRQTSFYSITPEWLVGFFEAEGSFITTKNSTPRIEITQHASDYVLLKAIQKFISGGTVRFDLRRSRCAIYTLSDKEIISDKLLLSLIDF